MTSASSVIGTWAYMAPERITAAKADARTDVYALACVLYECLTGSKPFPGDSLEQQVGGHIALPPPRASDRRADVPAELDAVIAKGMAKNPDERYSTTRELARAAKSAVTTPMPRPKPVTPTPPASFAGSYPPPPGPPKPSGPTQYRMEDLPTRRLPGSTGPNRLTPKPSRNRRIIAIAIAAVVAIVAVVAAIVLTNSRNEGAAPTESWPIADTSPQSSEPAL